MKKLAFVAAALAVLTAAPAFAAEACTVPADKWQPEDALKSKLEGEGWTVRQIKKDQGCYEAYAMKGDGSRMEALFDPATLAPVNAPAN
ncbi:PepSY domain-containing protein [Devosia sp. D6-9]|nr:PepSY domain-containing protein [Devosia sp. D6-9]